MMSKVLFTTSFDDGYVLDYKLALLLKRYNIKSTFYVPLENRERPVLNKDNLVKISRMGFEIGSHSLTHPNLIKLNSRDLVYEIVKSKSNLEKIRISTPKVAPVGNVMD